MPHQTSSTSTTSATSTGASCSQKQVSRRHSSKSNMPCSAIPECDGIFEELKGVDPASSSPGHQKLTYSFSDVCSRASSTSLDSFKACFHINIVIITEMPILV